MTRTEVMRSSLHDQQIRGLRVLEQLHLLLCVGDGVDDVVRALSIEASRISTPHIETHVTLSY